ncbi:hypothetical protein NDU88_006142 [Pleurodeles waltl]|uniref:Uncharacterized protein n=1 Tax=Pleurodeles waltl TaxID=8319 RepID=A0AAV7LTZ4_PLEWA|nr:hypothetical protein NDU88_006142 [Pleurodeles waltl]
MAPRVDQCPCQALLRAILLGQAAAGTPKGHTQAAVQPVRRPAAPSGFSVHQARPRKHPRCLTAAPLWRSQAEQSYLCLAWSGHLLAVSRLQRPTAIACRVPSNRGNQVGGLVAGCFG